MSVQVMRWNCTNEEAPALAKLVKAATLWGYMVTSGDEAFYPTPFASVVERRVFEEQVEAAIVTVLPYDGGGALKRVCGLIACLEDGGEAGEECAEAMLEELYPTVDLQELRDLVKVTLTPLDQLRCPHCGALPRGDMNTVVADFSLELEDDGTVSVAWTGDTDLSTQETQYERGLPVLCCLNGHTYQSKYYTEEALARGTIKVTDDPLPF